MRKEEVCRGENSNDEHANMMKVRLLTHHSVEVLRKALRLAQGLAGLVGDAEAEVELELLE